MPSTSLAARLGVVLLLVLPACVAEPAPRPRAAACDVAITGVTVVDVDAGALLPDRTVELCGSRIGAVRPAGDLGGAGRHANHRRARASILIPPSTPGARWRPTGLPGHGCS